MGLQVNLDKDNIEAYTPKYAVDIIVPFLDKSKVIWAPFSKDEHNFANYLRSLGFKVINTHIETGQDFLKYVPDFEFDIILDNPPFKGKTKFVEKALNYGKPFAFFLNYNSLGDQGIPNLFLERNLDIQMLIPDKIAEFLNQKQTGISFKTVYICWNILPKQLMLCKMNKKKGNE